ncbi:SAM-dependent methyltransferase [Streptomyces sp. AcH 505]|uniref:SAM-dependent methyltransferase n=1 Tax=Streptomyces sp. AcH 505 TaxID=352211 RepID=UPI000693BE88
MTDHEPEAAGPAGVRRRPPKPQVDTSKPQSARMYDYYLGGKDNYPVDRAAAEQVLTAFPNLRYGALANRRFLTRAVRDLVGAGIDQFLDIGTGIPTSPNTHQVAQGLNPAARVAYADNDPIVLAHAQALLVSTPQGRTTYIEGNLKKPGTILESAELAEVIDFDRPVAVMLLAVLHFVEDGEGAYEIVRTLMDAMPSGSHLVLSHATNEFAPEEWARVHATYKASGISGQIRDRPEILRFFDGLEMLEPGLQVIHRWRPDPAPADPTSREDGPDDEAPAPPADPFAGYSADQLDAMISGYAGVARKP